MNTYPMPLSRPAMGTSVPSAFGAKRRMATWAASWSPSTTARNGPTLAGIFASWARLASR